MSLSGRRALVTGASGALGAAIATRLARDGAALLLHANSRPDAVERLAQSIREAGGHAETTIFDITDRDAARAACERLLDAGPVQVIINNAGVHDDAAFPALRAEQWHRVIDVSLHGFFHVTQPLLLPMLRTRWGRIVNISSVAALAGNRGQVNYAAAKGGLNSATTRAVARSGEPRRDGERDRARHHRVADEHRGVRRREDRATGAGTPHRHAG